MAYQGKPAIGQRDLPAVRVAAEEQVALQILDARQQVGEVGENDAQGALFLGWELAYPAGVEVEAVDTGDADEFHASLIVPHQATFAGEQADVPIEHFGSEQVAVVVAEDGKCPEAAGELREKAMGDGHRRAMIALVVDEIAGE